MIVADTSVWVAVLRPRPHRSTADSKAFTDLLDADENLLVAPVRTELLRGVRPADRRALQRALTALPIAYPTDETWKLMDQWAMKAAERGEHFGVGDLLIGAIAREAGAPSGHWISTSPGWRGCTSSSSMSRFDVRELCGIKFMVVSERFQTWLTALVVTLGVIAAAGMSLYSFLTSTAPPSLHPNPEAAPSVKAATPSARWNEAVNEGQRIARAALGGQDLPGISVAVGVGDEIVWAEAFGWANLEKRVPAAPTMRFRLGHASKALTSAVVGQLVEQGQLDLDSEIQTYVPEFPKKAWPITLRQLMGHTAGIRHYENEADFMPSAHCTSASEGLSRFAGDPLLFEPETAYKYSTFGWVLVSAAVEAAAGEPFDRVMRAKIFDPSGMTRTSFDSAGGPPADLATFYEAGWLDARRPARDVDYSCFAGAGAIVSTPSDLVRFGLALDNGTLLRSETVRMLHTRQALVSGKSTEYGLGWMLDATPLAGETAELANHANRTLVGSSVSFLLFPHRGLAVAAMTNISYANMRDVALNVAEAFAIAARQLRR